MFRFARWLPARVFAVRGVGVVAVMYAIGCAWCSIEAGRLRLHISELRIQCAAGERFCALHPSNGIPSQSVRSHPTH